MTDTTAAVQAGVNAYAKAEASLQDAHDALLVFPGTYAALFQDKTIGYLESMERSSAARSLAGTVADALNAVLVNHQKDTARATALGIDLPSPPAAGTVHPDGGGR